MAIEAFNLKNEILSDFHDVTNIQIFDQTVKGTLLKLRSNEKFQSISFYQYIAEEINKRTESYTDELDTDLGDYMFRMHYEELQEDFHSWFTYIDYYCSKAIIGPIISTSKVPDNIKEYFNEIKEAYAFCLYRSCIGLCRAMLEMGLHDKLNRKGVFKTNDPKVISIDIAKEDSLNRYIYLSKKEGILDKINAEKAHSIRKYANKILHHKNDPINCTKKDAFQIINNTIGVLEYIYK